MKNHERKCEHCDHWNDAKLTDCENCGNQFDEEFREDMEKLRNKPIFDVKVIKINEDDSPPVKFLKKIVQIHQLILYAIIGFLIYLSTVFSH